MWAVDAVAAAVGHASPALARAVATICAAPASEARATRRAVVSTLRYVLRMEHRATPFGLFAGVAPARFGDRTTVVWGAGHREVVRADAAWLADVVGRLESIPGVLERLEVVANDTVFLRGGRLVVPYPPRTGTGAPAEVSVRCTAAVRYAMGAAASPIRCSDLAAKLEAQFPAGPGRVLALLRGLVEAGALLTGLHAPSTVACGLMHLVGVLDGAEGGQVPAAAAFVEELHGVHGLFSAYEVADSPLSRRTARGTLYDAMRSVSKAAGQPVAVDVRADVGLMLPRAVAREAEAVAGVLARLTPHPFGTVAWRDFHNRFFERYGIGSLVPVLDVVDPDVGLGFPSGYLDTEPPSRPALSARDRRLLALAQDAARDGVVEIVLDEPLITRLTDEQVADAMRLPPHLELRFRVHASSPSALDAGDFRLTGVTASRGVGTTTGRFLGLLDPADRKAAVAVLATLPAGDSDAVPVQLSFPPLHRRDAHATRAPQVLPHTIHLTEHPINPGGISVRDLVVGCDRTRLYLASRSLGRRVEPVVLHALDLRFHAPPLARFLAEIGRAQAAVVTAFDWGAATALPFLPRLRYGRTVISPARWHLDAAELPGSHGPWDAWNRAMAAWRAQRSTMPARVMLAEGDRHLPLDLDTNAHLVLLRAAVDTAGHATLIEDDGPDARGWFDGHAHEIVTAMTAVGTPGWPAAPPVASSRVIGRDHGRLPGDSSWLLACLYGHRDRQAEIIATHLPALLTDWNDDSHAGLRTDSPSWYFLRYADPRPHLRLRIRLRDTAAFGAAAQRVGAWAAGLRRAGLLNELTLGTSYPETGRWGNGALMDAAEEVFAADSAALATQFAAFPRPGRAEHPDHRALAAANFVSLAAAFTGSAADGAAWLIEHAPVSSAPVDRAVFHAAVRLADPTDDWAALREVPGGTAVAAAWRPRDAAVRAYRDLIALDGGLNSDLVLDSLIHAHFIRAVGLDKDDERVCARLARAAAMAWTHARGTR
ncbi:lantibiotic dehydratase [Yinghuangia sp. ASG 101]|uniref:lantibiotic dehydratase n=1 Tax=Yinghuangia sp. ASG 101 TaxID=2896848 RepID=UPI001E56F66A|nr:lantibiotic dehydratase [Yinghuangia sp. ASG 101]UGQ15322.1 lantibiotic dehydratase [Yinghuangia sp. ASG 101]